jgi:hypothetical protein
MKYKAPSYKDMTKSRLTKGDGLKLSDSLLSKSIPRIGISGGWPVSGATFALYGGLSILP